MTRHCMISSLGGPRGRSHDSSKSHQENVEGMKSFWHGQLKQVLADRPDLVVVPEASDRYSSMSVEERHAYYLVRGEQLLEFWRGIATEHRTCVAYSAARQLEDGTWRNSTQIIGRDGTILGIYNKNHLVIEETTKSGIVLTGSAKEKPQYAVVVAVGPGGAVDGNDVPMYVHVGDKVV